MGLIRLNKVRLDSGGYDSRGVYWGVGQSLFEYCSHEKNIQGYLRAPDREFAKDYVRKLYPYARFYDDKLSCNICGEPIKPNNHRTCCAQARGRHEAADRGGRFQPVWRGDGPVLPHSGAADPGDEPQVGN